MTKGEFFDICSNWMSIRPDRVLVVHITGGCVALNDVGDVLTIVGYPVYTPREGRGYGTGGARLRRARQRFQRWLAEFIAAERCFAQAPQLAIGDGGPYWIKPLVWSQSSTGIRWHVINIAGVFRLWVQYDCEPGLFIWVCDSSCGNYRYAGGTCSSIEAGRLAAEAYYRRMLHGLLIPAHAGKVPVAEATPRLRELDLS